MSKYNKGDVCLASNSSLVACKVIGCRRDNNKHVYYKVRPISDACGYSVVRFLKLARMSKKDVYIRGDRLGFNIK